MKPLHKELKEIRLEKGIELKEISEKTKIRLDYLQSIEEGDFTVAPEPFLRAFLREYGEFVGVDPKLVMLKYDNKIQSILHPELIFEPSENEPVQEKTIGEKKPEEAKEQKKENQTNLFDENTVKEDIDKYEDHHEDPKKILTPSDEQGIGKGFIYNIKKSKKPFDQVDSLSPGDDEIDTIETLDEKPAFRNIPNNRERLIIEEPRSPSNVFFAIFIFIILIIALIIFFIN